MLNAAGSLGFAPDNRLAVTARLDGFFTNPISLSRRTPAGGTRLLPFPGGALLHTGHPNPGISAAIRQNADKWRRFDRPLFVHLLADHPDQFGRLVRRLESVEGVDGVELGMPPAVEPAVVVDSVKAAIGELPVLVKVELQQAESLVSLVQRAGASGLTIGPPRVSLKDGDGQFVRGRALGKGLYPLALETLRRMPFDLPIIFGTGLFRPDQVGEVLSLGAVGVQIDSALWRSGPLSRSLGDPDPIVPK